MNQKSAFFRVVIRLGLFLSNQMIPTNIMGNAKNFEEISRDHADEPSARKEEERERRTVSSTPDRSRRFFFSLSLAPKEDTHTTTNNNRREREIRRLKKGPKKRLEKTLFER